MKLKDYYDLTKPGIIYGNLLTFAAAFFFAARANVPWLLFLAAAAGISAVIASGCVCNNILDAGIDARMERTKGRALPMGRVPVAHALVFGLVLGIIGMYLLWWWVNAVSAMLALAALFLYAVVYTWLKPRSVWAAAVGTIPGAIPTAVGYTAVTGRFDLAALILLLILIAWQLPHFYAIAIYRKEEYAAARVPVLSVRYGVRVAQYFIAAHVLLFALAVSLLFLFHYAGYTYLALMLAVSLAWLYLSLKNVHTEEHIKNARKLFFFSLIVLLVFAFALAFLTRLP